MANVWKRIANALPGTVQGVMSGIDARSKWDKSAADAEYNRQMAELARRKADESMIDSLIKESGAGFQRDANGIPQVNPAYWDPNSDVYKRTAQEQQFKRMGMAGGKSQYEDLSPLAGNKQVQDLGLTAEQLKQLPVEGTLADILKKRFDPSVKTPLNAGQVFQLSGRPLPQGMDPNLGIDASYANIIPKPAAPPQGMRAADFFAAQGRPLPQGLHPDVIIPSSAGANFKPAVSADPSQIRAYESKFGPGTSRGLTPAQLMSGLATVGNQERLGAQFDKSEKRRQQEHDEDQALQRNKATTAPRKEAIAKIDFLDRLSGYAAQAATINPSWLDYQKLSAKANINSISGGRFSQLTPEDSERLGFYNSLSQDAIRTLFETGGKALTANEERLSQKLSIQPGDTPAQILAKIQGIQNFAKSKIMSELAEIERLNPGSANDLIQRLGGAEKKLGAAKKGLEAAVKPKPQAAKPSMTADLGDYVKSKIRGNPSDQRANSVAGAKVVKPSDTQVVAKGSASDQRANEVTAIRDARQTLEQARARIQQEMAANPRDIKDVSGRMNAFKQKLLNALSKELGRPVTESEIETGNSRGNYGR